MTTVLGRPITTRPTAAGSLQVRKGHNRHYGTYEGGTIVHSLALGFLWEYKNFGTAGCLPLDGESDRLQREKAEGEAQGWVSSRLCAGVLGRNGRRSRSPGTWRPRRPRPMSCRGSWSRPPPRPTLPVGFSRPSPWSPPSPPSSRLANFPQPLIVAGPPPLPRLMVFCGSLIE